MRGIRAAALCLVLLVPGIARAEAIAIPFAPPVDQRLTYQIEQHRPVEGKVSRFSATRDLRFERGGGRLYPPRHVARHRQRCACIGR
ncbi:hypothetical protein [Sphingobium sp. AS12]|uniref:hypothetical protein n=1 Tax=Sphingobium sp. AS12 TaxID=2849495 RepID=UPI0020C932FE|nr:hypothetical protein [Sphingobium sp. AS12]